MERLLIDRLSGNFSAAESLLQYLIGCYRRACDELKIIQSMKDKNRRSEMEIVTGKAKKLAVSYSRIYLANPDMFGNSDKTSGGMDKKLKKRNVSPVLALIFAGDSSGSLDSSRVQNPPGFLNELFKDDSDLHSLELIFKELYEDLRSMVINVSVLGDFQQPLWALKYLVNLPVGAKSLVSHECWVPRGDHMNGRAMELTSILGPFFHISALPDNTRFKSQPDVGQLYFSQVSERLLADLSSFFSTITTSMNILYDGLHEVLSSLLKKTDTRECVLQFLAQVINANASRAHIQVNSVSCASSGMFVNLSAVMLRLCQPFLLHPHSIERNKIDPKYAFCGHCLTLSDLTALHASSQDVSEWIDKYNTAKANDAGNGNEGRLFQSKEATSSSSNASGQNAKSTIKYSFTCECFFMTARVLNLGLIKALSRFKHLAQ